MNTQSAANADSVPLKNQALAAFLAWLVPGLGHFYQGRRAKALLYFVCVAGLFLAGLVLGDFKNVVWRWTSPMEDPEHFRYGYLCQFFVGLLALPALIQSTLESYGYGPILGGYLVNPPVAELNAAYLKLGKLFEVGWVYTMIAGLLNVFAIFDAFEGPAHGEAATESESVAQGSIRVEVAG